MSNYDNRQDKIVVHLAKLYIKHKALDTDIKELYKRYAKEEDLNQLKTKKLRLKDEIHKFKTELKALNEENI